MVNTMHSEANTCIHRHEGMCMKCWESCPSIVRYNDNNDNNVPCDMASYDPGRSTRNKEKTKTQKNAYYLTYFEINQDSDFYVELYKGLNYDYKLFENPVEAINAVKKHLKLAIDTFKTSKEIDYVKDVMEEIYNDPLTWEVEDTDQDEIIFLIDESLGNYDIQYCIRRVSFYK